MISLWQLLTLLLFGGDRYISSAESHAVGWELSCHWWLTVSISSKPTCHDDGMDSRTCTQHTGFTLVHHCQAVTQFISNHWPVPYFGGFLFLCVNYKSNKNVSSWFLWVLSHCFLDDRKGIWCVKNDYYLSPRGFLLEQAEEENWAYNTIDNSAGAVQAVCSSPSMSAAQGTTVHDGLLHPHLRHCSPAAISCSYLDSRVRCLVIRFVFCGWPGSLKLITRLPARSVTFLWQFSTGPESFSLALLVYTAH